MIQVLKSNQIDPVKWDTCIHASPNGNIYGLYGSIQIACHEWLGLVQDDYTSVAALPVKRKLGLTYSWHPQFLGPLGIFSKDENQIDLNEFIDAFKKSSWWIKMFYWQYLPSDFQVESWNYQLLEFGNRSPEEIKRGYNENTRRNISKAVKLDVRMHDSDSEDTLVQNFRSEKGDQIKNLNNESYALLQRLMNHWITMGLAEIKSVYQNETLLAIGCFLTWRNRVVYYKGVVTTAGKNTGAMHYLLDHQIQRSVKPGHVFDFGGSNTDSVARFYTGFGGTNNQFYLNEFKRFKI